MEKESLTIKLVKSSFSTSSINIIAARPQNVYLVKVEVSTLGNQFVINIKNEKEKY